MQAIAPATISTEIHEKIKCYSDGRFRYSAIPELDFKRLERDIDKLANVDRGTACLLRGFLYEIQGYPVTQIESLFDEAQYHGISSLVVGKNKLHLFVRRAYSLKAQEFLKSFIKPRDGVVLDNDLLNQALHACSPMFLLEKLQESKMLGHISDAATLSIISKLEHHADVMTCLKITDADLATLMDCAGELLEQEKLFACGYRYNMSQDLTDPFFQIGLLTGISPQRAAGLTLDLIDTFIDKALDHIPVSIYFSGEE